MSSALGIYQDDVFKMACEQFRVIADYLEIDQNHRERLMLPKRAIAVTLPVHMDDGSTQTFQETRKTLQRTSPSRFGCKSRLGNYCLWDGFDMVNDG